MWLSVCLATLFVCRSKGYCKPCPNSAWLLFVLFAVVLVVLVALSVYLSKKRLNLAILGIGVVRGMACGLQGQC